MFKCFCMNSEYKVKLILLTEYYLSSVVYSENKLLSWSQVYGRFQTHEFQ